MVGTEISDAPALVARIGNQTGHVAVAQITLPIRAIGLGLVTHKVITSDQRPIDNGDRVRQEVINDADHLCRRLDQPSNRHIGEIEFTPLEGQPGRGRVIIIREEIILLKRGTGRVIEIQR